MIQGALEEEPSGRGARRPEDDPPEFWLSYRLCDPDHALGILSPGFLI